jgi:hypothetical protein
MPCNICSDTLPSTVPIKTPDGLWNAVAWIRAEISAGRLLRVPDLAGGTRFKDLEPRSGWPDHILHRFHCAGCRDVFELSCETYHGSGGQLRRVG